VNYSCYLTLLTNVFADDLRLTNFVQFFVQLSSLPSRMIILFVYLGVNN